MPNLPQPNPPHTKPPRQLATHTMIDRLPCPIPGCNHSPATTHALAPTDTSPPNLLYYAISTTTTTKPPSTLPTNQSAPPQTSTPVPNIPAQPHRHASSAPSTISLNTTPYIIHCHQYIHLLPPSTHHPHPPTLLTSEHQSSTQTARTGLTTYGTLASPSSYNTPTTTHPTSETHGADTSNTATV